MPDEAVEGSAMAGSNASLILPFGPHLVLKNRQVHVLGENVCGVAPRQILDRLPAGNRVLALNLSIITNGRNEPCSLRAGAGS